MFKVYKIFSLKFLIYLSFLIFITSCCYKKNKNPKLIVINILDKKLFDDCHIKGSINIEFDKFEKEMQKLEKNNEYIIYCTDALCLSSDYIVTEMKKNGFLNVKKYGGGICEWYQNGLPVIGAAKENYLKSKIAKTPSKKIDSITATELQNKMNEFKLL